MYTLIREAGRLEAIQTERSTLVASLVIAELLYKFHSFVLEFAAFLVTWYVLGWIAEGGRRATRLWRRRSGGAR